ncbi:MAG: hypothetical protein SPL05_07545 [Eubacteriales bacterium]|nr:hypothetical protein [Eubacteriales bacterium]
MRNFVKYFMSAMFGIYKICKIKIRKSKRRLAFVFFGNAKAQKKSVLF